MNSVWNSDDRISPVEIRPVTKYEGVVIGYIHRGVNSTLIGGLIRYMNSVWNSDDRISPVEIRPVTGYEGVAIGNINRGVNRN